MSGYGGESIISSVTMSSWFGGTRRMKLLHLISKCRTRAECTASMIIRASTYRAVGRGKRRVGEGM